MCRESTKIQIHLFITVFCQREVCYNSLHAGRHHLPQPALYEESPNACTPGVPWYSAKGCGVLEDSPPDEQTLRDLIKKLGIEPQDLLRQKEYHKLQLPETDDPDELISQMAANPQIIERPLVVCGRRARIGRPPENVLEIVDVASS